MAKAGRPKTPVRPTGLRGRLPGQKNKPEKLRFKKYIHQTLKGQFLNMKLKKSTMVLLNSFVEDIFKKVMREAGDFVEHSKKKTLTYKAVESSVRILFPDDLRKYCIEDA